LGGGSDNRLSRRTSMLINLMLSAVLYLLGLFLVETTADLVRSLARHI